RRSFRKSHPIWKESRSTTAGSSSTASTTSAAPSKRPRPLPPTAWATTTPAPYGWEVPSFCMPSSNDVEGLGISVPPTKYQCPRTNLRLHGPQPKPSQHARLHRPVADSKNPRETPFPRLVGGGNILPRVRFDSRHAGHVRRQAGRVNERGAGT